MRPLGRFFDILGTLLILLVPMGFLVALGHPCYASALKISLAGQC